MKKPRKPVVAIDGPAGAGKSSAANLLAQRLGFVLVDTGALYRGVALEALRRGVPLDDGERLGELTRHLDLRFDNADDGSSHLWVNGQDCADQIRTQEVAQAASDVSRFPEVRDALLELQRNLGQQGGVILEGRDIGTVVFPDAELKVFLTASVEARAQRRFLELNNKGVSTTLEEILDQIRQRDRQDSNRTIAPLRPAADAVIMDSTDLGLNQVVESLRALVLERWQASPKQLSND